MKQEAPLPPSGSAPYPRRDRLQVSAAVRRVLKLCAVLVLAGIGYGYVVTWLNVSFEPEEQLFGAPPAQGRIGVYVQAITVDSANDTMQLRISVTPPAASGESNSVSLSDRELVLMVYRPTNAQRIQIHANQSFPEATVDVDFDKGSIRDYPLDVYDAVVDLACFEGVNEAAGPAIPMTVTIWEGILGYAISSRELASSQPGHLRLNFTVQRTGAVKFFGLAAYGAMIVLAMCALTLGVLVVSGVRKIEVTLFGAVGAIVFALPALRNALPGGPPLGTRADVVVFFWTELAAVLALCMLVIAWARGGARPGT